MTTVGFVGAGRMGAPMVARLVAAGHTVRAVGRTVDDPAGAADGADVVVVCVFSDEQVRQLCLDGDLVAQMRPGATLVVHTTGSPRTAQTIAERFARVDVVDAPVSGGPHDIAAGEVTLFVGGSDEAVARVGPLLSAYGDPILHVGGTGTGQLVKLVNNTLFAAQIGLVREGTRLGARLGIGEGPLLTALTHGSALSRVLSMVEAAGSAGAFASAVGQFVGKDVAVVRGTVAELGGDLGMLDALVDAGIHA
jgi:3-hydroxyisobutyrate dehydrogenase-like beta-hydroxyacid dehydrogenase